MFANETTWLPAPVFYLQAAGTTDQTDSQTLFCESQLKYLCDLDHCVTFRKMLKV